MHQHIRNSSKISQKAHIDTFECFILNYLLRVMLSRYLERNTPIFLQTFIQFVKIRRLVIKILNDISCKMVSPSG